MNSLSRFSKGRPGCYLLKDLKNGQYQLHAEDGPAFEGTEFAITIAADEMGLDSDDVEFAKKEMREKNHDWAHFGVMGRFIFSGTTKERKVA